MKTRNNKKIININKNKLEFNFYFLVYLVKFIVLALAFIGAIMFSAKDEENYVSFK